MRGCSRRPTRSARRLIIEYAQGLNKHFQMKTDSAEAERLWGRNQEARADESTPYEVPWALG